MQNLEVLKYWIEERHIIRQLKVAGRPKPWSNDPIFQNTYFCNVRREDDKVTKFLRGTFFGFGNRMNHPMYEVNAVLARFINWPDTLRRIGFFMSPEWYLLEKELNKIEGKVWGDAYIVSTNGRAMPKAQYLCEMLLPAAYAALGPGGTMVGYPSSPTLAARHKQLTGVYGLGSFMAAQIIADLKNTIQHPLMGASDWWTWCAPGPGSKRGISWLTFGVSDGPISTADFLGSIAHVRQELVSMGCELIHEICNQDLQNCLCEFDKYCRVKSGTGRSKRSYNGT